MTDDMKPNHIIIHTGTNDLAKNLDPEKIANDIIKLALTINKEEIGLIISGLVPRDDDYNSKCFEVNLYLQALCKDRNGEH